MVKAEHEDDTPVVISEDEARAGVTGHHVRYVLAFGLVGAIVAYVAIGFYYYYAELRTALEQIRTDPSALVSYVVPIALATVVVVLLLGLWNMSRPNVSQTWMRWRVVLQFIALCLVMAALYLGAK